MAKSRLLSVLVDGIDGAPPKLIAAIGDYADGAGLAPQELIDVSLAERFGWTWQELDEADMSQVLPSVAAANIYAALQRYYHWLDMAGQGATVSFPSDDDGRIWQAVTAAQKDKNA